MDRVIHTLNNWRHLEELGILFFRITLGRATVGLNWVEENDRQSKFSIRWKQHETLGYKCSRTFWTAKQLILKHLTFSCFLQVSWMVCAFWTLPWKKKTFYDKNESTQKLKTICATLFFIFSFQGKSPKRCRSPLNLESKESHASRAWQSLQKAKKCSINVWPYRSLSTSPVQMLLTAPNKPRRLNLQVEMLMATVFFLH